MQKINGFIDSKKNESMEYVEYFMLLWYKGIGVRNMIDFELYRIFVAVADEENITRASEKTKYFTTCNYKTN